MPNEGRKERARAADAGVGRVRPMQNLGQNELRPDRAKIDAKSRWEPRITELVPALLGQGNMAAENRYLDADPDGELENETPIHWAHGAEELTAEQACAKAQAACPALATWGLNLALAAATRAKKRLEKKGEL